MIEDPFHALSKKLTFKERMVFYVRSSHETEFRSICPFGSKSLLENDLQTESLHNMTEDFSPKALVVVERLLELLGKGSG